MIVNQKFEFSLMHLRFYKQSLVGHVLDIFPSSSSFFSDALGLHMLVDTVLK